MPQASLMGRPGAAFLPRTSRLNRKRTFAPLYYFDANQEQTVRERTTRMIAFVSESRADSRASESEVSNTWWHSTCASEPPTSGHRGTLGSRRLQLRRWSKRRRCCWPRGDPVIIDTARGTHPPTHPYPHSHSGDVSPDPVGSPRAPSHFLPRLEKLLLRLEALHFPLLLSINTIA